MITADDIEASVNEALLQVEQDYGKAYAKAVHVALDCTLSDLICHGKENNLHPGRLMTAFIDVIVAIDRRAALLAKADAIIAMVEEQSALGQIN